MEEKDQKQEELGRRVLRGERRGSLGECEEDDWEAAKFLFTGSCEWGRIHGRRINSVDITTLAKITSESSERGKEVRQVPGRYFHLDYTQREESGRSSTADWKVLEVNQRSQQRECEPTEVQSRGEAEDWLWWVTDGVQTHEISTRRSGDSSAPEERMRNWWLLHDTSAILICRRAALPPLILNNSYIHLRAYTLRISQIAHTFSTR